MLLTALLPLLFMSDSLASDVGDATALHPDGQFSGAFVAALLDRIDRLEEKLEERDRQHTTSISKLRDEYRKEMAAVHRELATQKKRMSWLEAVARHQQRRIKDPMKFPPRSNPAEQAVQEVEKDAEHQSVPGRPKPRIRRANIDVEVAFMTTLSTTTSHLGANQNVVFDTVITNIGNAYHVHLGSFIAPVAGTYVFSTSLMTEGRHVSHYGLYQNAKQLVRLFLNGAESAYDGASQTVVVRLAQADDVTIRHLDVDHGLNGGVFCSFAGFLLSQDFSDTSTQIIGK